MSINALITYREMAAFISGIKAGDRFYVADFAILRHEARRHDERSAYLFELINAYDLFHVAGPIAKALG